MESDAELLRKAASDPDAFAEVCRRHVAALHASIVSRTGDAGVASELVAETLAQAWTCRRRFRDEADGSAGPWLSGIAQNLVRQYLRRRRVETAARRRLGMPYRPDDVYAEVDERLAAAADAGRLRRALAGLSSRQRSAVELRVLDDLSYGEVAERLGCSETAARLQVSRALRSLRSRLSGGGA